MRERRTFGARTEVLHSPGRRRKFFLIYEGSHTEPIYFEALYQRRDFSGFHPLIELVPLVRTYSEEGHSNPKKIVERVLDDLRASSEGIVTYQNLIDWILDDLSEQEGWKRHNTQSEYIRNLLYSLLAHDLHGKPEDSVANLSGACAQIADSLRSETKVQNIVRHIPEIFRSPFSSYDQDLDCICLIVDRDPDSFTKEQYAYVLETCQREKIGFYITNPNFEFWLLLHYEDVHTLDREKLLSNPKVRANRRYTEQEMRNRMPNYHKSYPRIAELVQKVDTAILNEKQFCEDAELLEHEIGSRVGLLIQEMRIVPEHGTVVEAQPAKTPET